MSNTIHTTSCQRRDVDAKTQDLVAARRKNPQIVAFREGVALPLAIFQSFNRAFLDIFKTEVK